MENMKGGKTQLLVNKFNLWRLVFANSTVNLLAHNLNTLIDLKQMYELTSLNILRYIWIVSAQNTECQTTHLVELIYENPKPESNRICLLCIWAINICQKNAKV